MWIMWIITLSFKEKFIASGDNEENFGDNEELVGDSDELLVLEDILKQFSILISPSW